MALTEIESLNSLLNIRLVQVDEAILEALTTLNRIRALHGKKALKPEDFMLYYRGQRMKMKGEVV